jgi:hypothetical protein
MAVRRLVCITTFATMIKGVEVIVRDGEEFAANSPIVKGREHLFKPATAAGARADTSRGPV